MTDELESPNGLCFSPDYTKLYIADTGTDPPHPMFVYDVIDSASLKNGQIFHNVGSGLADGIHCDVDGNIWSSAGWVGKRYDGVHIIAPDGDLIDKIHLPEVCANLCLGGVQRNRLFMTASRSPDAVSVETQGVQLW